MAQSGKQFPLLFQNKTPFISVCSLPAPLSHKNPCTLAPYHDPISKEINVAEGTEVKGNATHPVAF